MRKDAKRENHRPEITVTPKASRLLRVQVSVVAMTIFLGLITEFGEENGQKNYLYKQTEDWFLNDRPNWRVGLEYHSKME